MRALVIGLLLAFCHNAKAADFDVLAGSTFVRGPTGVVAMNAIFPKMIGHYANLEVGLDIIGETSFYCPLNRECDAIQAVAHAEVVAPIHGFEVGLGLAKIAHDDKYNSGLVNFSLSLEHKLFKNMVVRYQHFSNAGITRPNEGRDMVLVGWRF